MAFNGVGVWCRDIPQITTPGGPSITSGQGRDPKPRTCGLLWRDPWAHHSGRSPSRKTQATRHRRRRTYSARGQTSEDISMRRGMGPGSTVVREMYGRSGLKKKF